MRRAITYPEPTATMQLSEKAKVRCLVSTLAVTALVAVASLVMVFLLSSKVTELSAALSRTSGTADTQGRQLTALAADLAAIKGTPGAIEQLGEQSKRDVSSLKSVLRNFSERIVKLETGSTADTAALAALQADAKKLADRLGAAETASAEAKRVADSNVDRIKKVWDRLGDVSSQVAVVSGASEFNTQRLISAQGDIAVLQNPPKGRKHVNPFMRQEGRDLVADPGKVEAAIAAYIQRYQHLAVRPSYGKYEGECFSDKEYQDFLSTKSALAIVTEFKAGSDYVDLCAALSDMTPPFREALLTRMSKLCRKTWTELGRISSEGTTAPGQKAELMIADMIAKALREGVK